jgi:hypothetical protein
MRVILADSIDGGILLILVMLAGLAVSLLAILALFPAAYGKKAATLLMAAPAFFAGVAVTIWLGLTYVQSDDHSSSEFWNACLAPWLLFAGPSFGTSLLAGLILWSRRRKIAAAKASAPGAEGVLPSDGQTDQTH